ncbi:MAG TPA: hypothetical protein DCX96_09380 [Oscillibacter sp.]|nr:hypothetical protein [Oscillibacter sp.]
MKKCINNRTMSFRRLLSLLLGLVLFMELLPGGLTVVGDASDAVTVTVDGAKTTQVTLPQSGRVTLEATSETGDTDYQWQIQLDGDWVNIYDATAATLTLTYAMVSPALEGGSAAVRCAAGGESVSDAVRVTVSYDVEADAAALNRQRDELTQGMSAAAAPRRTQRRASRSGAPEYINVTVNYLDAVTSLPIYTGFSATIKGGELYSQTVLSPTYLGYAPYWNPTDPATTDPGAATESAQSLTLSVGENYTGETYTVNVYYKAIAVPYAVRYYFQNIHDDMYTENVDYYRRGSALTGTIIANDNLKLDEVRASGFTKLYHYPEAVAADGSTVFECYYDRNYYQVKLDANGGYGSEHVYARYGTPFVATTPTRHGYRFAGWDKLGEDGVGDGEEDELPTTVPAENASYIALWESADTTYTVVYWLKNAEGTEYDYMGSQKRSAVAGEVVSGDASWLTADSYICGLTEDAGHTHNEGCKPELFRHSQYEKADENVTIEGDGSTTVNIYYTRKSYTLRFYYAKEYVSANDTVNSPANPSDTPVYSVVGGSTRPFGFYQETGACVRPQKDGKTVNDVESLLYNVRSGDWGEVAELPTIQQPTGTAYTYTLGTYPDGGGYNAKGDRFHYLEFTVPYGTDLLHLWPTEEVFGQIKTARSGYDANKASEHRGEGQWGNYAYFAGWNGEFNIKYTQDNSNSTIKCYYPLLDDTLLYDESRISTYGDSDRVSFLAFFDNGANVKWSIPRQWIYKLYVEVLPGHEEDEGVAARTVDGVTRYYMLYDTVFANDDNKDIEHQTDPPLPGFTCMRDKTGGSEREINEPLADGRESYTANFYYNRNSYTLTAQNYDEIIQYNDVLYQADLDRRMYDLLLMPYPKPLEKYAYELGGWYTSPGCFPGSEYVPGSTMPEHDISLYAKWEPVTYTVRLFKNRKDMETYQTTGNEALVYHTQVVDHGSTLGEIADPTDPSGHGYTFGGWFYEKSGKKVALTPTDTAVKENLLVYAEWSHLTAQPYLIHYVLKETADKEWKELLGHASLFSPEDGKAYTVTNGSGESRTYIYYAGEGGGYHRQIAADSRGYANQGSTRTFYPKAGDPYNQLYSGFNSGYYPTLASHSITMEEDTPSNPTVNVFTFYYVHAATVSYKVEYRYHDTGELIESESTGTGSVAKSTSKAVVTERFAVVKDYVPDAFYKRLVLAVVEDGNGGYMGSADNVVTFYYTKNIENAYYAVHYMLQNVDAATDELSLKPDGTYANYTESTVYTEGIGQIGATISITPQEFSGFTMRDTASVRWGDSSDTVQVSAGAFSLTVQKEGTELYVFYTRNTQTYTTYYLRYGSDPHSTRPEDELAASKTDSGKYGAVVTATAKSIDGYNCVSSASQSIVLRPNDKQNYIIFYYEPLQYTVEYRVWAYNGGTLDNTLEVVEGKNSFKGATPAAKSGYTFVGWYQNAECTIPVGEKGTIDDATGKLTPKRSELLPAPQTNVFYARFKAVYGNVTITREATEDESNGVGTYVYRLTSKDNPAYVVEVTVPAGGSTTVYDLPCGDYTVEQVNSWSWRYADGAQTVTVEDSQTKTVTFDGASTKDKWLTGSSDAVVNRREA